MTGPCVIQVVEAPSPPIVVEVLAVDQPASVIEVQVPGIPGPVGPPGPPGQPGSGVIATNIPTTQALSSGALVNLVQAGATTNVRLADASLGIEAHGYVLQAYALGALATIYDSGPNNSLGGLTAGEDYFLGVAGMVALMPYDATNPANTGKIIQPVGTSLNTTTLIFSVTTVTHL